LQNSSSLEVREANLSAYNDLTILSKGKEKFWSMVEDYNYSVVYRLIEKFIGVKNKIVCELGCGTAAHLKWYKRDCLRTVGLDISRGMLKLYVRSEGKAKNLFFVVGDALNLPFKNDAFDVVTIYQSAHHFPCIYRCIDEMIRVSAAFAFFEPNRDSLIHRIIEWWRERHMRDDRFRQHSYKVVEYHHKGFSATQIRHYLKSRRINIQVRYIFSLPMEISANIMRYNSVLFTILNLFGQALTHIPVFNSQFGSLLVMAREKSRDNNMI
jgi:hypothetical protein